MGNVKKAKLKPETEEPVVEKVVSVKRVAIASVLCIIVTGTFIWLLSVGAQKLIDSTDTPVQYPHTSTEVRLPQKGDASHILGEAKKSIDNFSLDSYTATGSAARSVIDTLQNLQKSDVGIEDYFCKIFCH